MKMRILPRGKARGARKFILRGIRTRKNAEFDGKSAEFDVGTVLIRSSVDQLLEYAGNQHSSFWIWQEIPMCLFVEPPGYTVLVAPILNYFG